MGLRPCWLDLWWVPPHPWSDHVVLVQRLGLTIHLTLCGGQGCWPHQAALLSCCVLIAGPDTGTGLGGPRPGLTACLGGALSVLPFLTLVPSLLTLILTDPALNLCSMATSLFLRFSSLSEPPQCLPLSWLRSGVPSIGFPKRLLWRDRPPPPPPPPTQPGNPPGNCTPPLSTVRVPAVRHPPRWVRSDL